MARLAITTFIIICLVNNLGAQDCKCIAAKRSETTRQGYFADIIVIEKKPFKQIRGVVHFPSTDASLDGALVEVFTRPEYLLKSKYPENVSRNQKRMAACWTGADGKFYFKGVPKGAYELRFSKDGGWSITHVYIVINPNSRRSTNAKIIVEMTPGA